MKATINTYRRLFIMMTLFSFVLIGAVMNLGVQAMNGGKMPVLGISASNTDTHFTFNEKEEIKGYYLSDIIALPISDKGACPTRCMWSLGDIILILFTFFMIVYGAYSIVQEVREWKKQRWEKNMMQ